MKNKGFKEKKNESSRVLFSKLYIYIYIYIYIYRERERERERTNFWLGFCPNINGYEVMKNSKYVSSLYAQSDFLCTR